MTIIEMDREWMVMANVFISKKQIKSLSRQEEFWWKLNNCIWIVSLSTERINIFLFNFNSFFLSLSFFSLFLTRAADSKTSSQRILFQTHFRSWYWNVFLRLHLTLFTKKRKRIPRAVAVTSHTTFHTQSLFKHKVFMFRMREWNFQQRRHSLVRKFIQWQERIYAAIIEEVHFFSLDF